MGTLDEARALDALYSTGLWLLEQGRIADAARVFQAMMVCRPSDERGWLALGACHERREELQIAYSLYEAGRHAAAPSARCELARARAARALGHEEIAEEAYESAIEVAERHDQDELRALAAAEKVAP